MRRLFFLFTLLSASAFASGAKDLANNLGIAREENPYTSHHFCSRWMSGHQFTAKDFAGLQEYAYSHFIEKLKEFCDPAQDKKLCSPFLEADYGYINPDAVEAGHWAPVVLLNARLKELRTAAVSYTDAIDFVYEKFVNSKEESSVNKAICDLFFSSYTNLKIGLWGAHPLWTQERTTDGGEKYSYSTNPFFIPYFFKEAFQLLVEESKHLRSQFLLNPSTGKYYYPHSLAKLIEGYRLPGLPSQGLSLGCQGDECYQALKSLGYSIDRHGNLDQLSKGVCPEVKTVEKIVYVEKSVEKKVVEYRDREIIKEVPAKSAGGTAAGSMFTYGFGSFVNDVTKAPETVVTLLDKAQAAYGTQAYSQYFDSVKRNLFVLGMKADGYEGKFEERALEILNTEWSDRAGHYALGWVKSTTEEKLKQLGTSLAKSGATLAAEYAVSWGAHKAGMSMACANVLAHELGAVTRAAMGSGPVGFALDQVFYLYTGWDDIKNCYQSVMYVHKG